MFTILSALVSNLRIHVYIFKVSRSNEEWPRQSCEVDEKWTSCGFVGFKKSVENDKCNMSYQTRMTTDNYILMP